MKLINDIGEPLCQLSRPLLTLPAATHKTTGSSLRYEKLQGIHPNDKEFIYFDALAHPAQQEATGNALVRIFKRYLLIILCSL